MQGALLAIAFMTLIGVPIARTRGLQGIGLAFLYGSGWMFFALLALSLLHISWTVVAVVIAGLLACLVAVLPGSRQPSNPATRFHWLDLLTLITLTGFTIFATIFPM